MVSFLQHFLVDLFYFLVLLNITSTFLRLGWSFLYFRFAFSMFLTLRMLPMIRFFFLLGFLCLMVLFFVWMFLLCLINFCTRWNFFRTWFRFLLLVVLLGGTVFPGGAGLAWGIFFKMALISWFSASRAVILWRSGSRAVFIWVFNSYASIFKSRFNSKIYTKMK